jgi:hypothetical protein
MTVDQVFAQLDANRRAQARADALTLARVFAQPMPVARPAYASETCSRAMTAYDYNGR